MCTFVNFTIVILTWYDITPYSLVLPMSISAQIFWPWSIYFRCIFYVTNWIAHKGFGIIELWPYVWCTLCYGTPVKKRIKSHVFLHHTWFFINSLERSRRADSGKTWSFEKKTFDEVMCKRDILLLRTQYIFTGHNGQMWVNMTSSKDVQTCHRINIRIRWHVCTPFDDVIFTHICPLCPVKRYFAP